MYLMVKHLKCRKTMVDSRCREENMEYRVNNLIYAVGVILLKSKKTKGEL